MNINKAIEDMNKVIPESKEIIPIKDKEDKPVRGRPKLIDKAMEARLIELAEELFFIRSIAGEAGIDVKTIERHLAEKENEEFVLSFAYAMNRFIAYHQRLMMQYAKDKKTKDWHAIKYLLTIADKEFSERKYLTEAVANQDAKILMLIKAEQLTIAGKKGKKMLESVVNTPSQKEETISLLPFKPEDPKNKLKAKKGKNKGLSTSRPSGE